MSIDWSKYTVSDERAPSQDEKGEGFWDKYTVKNEETTEEQPFAPGTALVKGVLKGTKGLASSGDPLRAITQAFMPASGTEEFQDQLIEKYFPSGETGIEKGAERVGEALPYAAGGGPAPFIKAILAGSSGQALEEMGAPKWLQNLAEFAIYMSPKGGKIKAPSQKEAVNFLKRKGVSDKEIPMLLQSEKKIRKLGKFGHKGQRIKGRVKNVQEKLGESYDRLKEVGRDKLLPNEHVVSFEDEIRDTFNKLTRRQKKLVEKDVRGLLSKPITASSMINFSQDILSATRESARKGHVSPKTASRKLKGVIRKYMPYADEEIAKDYELTDQFYKKNKDIFKTLSSSEYDNMIDVAEAYGVGKGILTGNLGLLTASLGTIGARALATEMLINPRLQNLRKQMIKEGARNRPQIFRQLHDKFVGEVKKELPEVAQKLKKEKSNEKK